MSKIIGVDAAKLAGLQIDQLQKLRNGEMTVQHMEWFNNLAKEDRDNLLAGIGFERQDTRFSLVSTFELTVPVNYVHATCLASFAKRNRKNFYYYNDAITDKNFSKATNELVPGRKFAAKIFQINKRVKSEDCLTFLKKQNAVLVGAQGASLAYELAKEKLPIGKWSVSFDEKEALWQDSDGYLRVPFLCRDSDGDWHFHLGHFENAWGDDSCLLCFCDFPPEAD